MTVSIFGYPKYKFFLPGTNTLAVGAQLFTYEPGTTTKKTTYQDFDKNTANSNPIVLDANAEATVWLDGKTKLVLAPSNDTDPPASPYHTLDDVGDEDVTASAVGVSNKISNGSFEIDANGDNIPDDWTLTAGTGNTLAVDATANYHGLNSLKFTIASANTAVAETDFFEVNEGIEEILRFGILGSAADASVVVRLVWYTGAQVFISNTDVYTDSSTVPTSWTDKGFSFTPVTNARYAKLQLRVATTGKTVNFDNVRTYALDDHDVARTYTGQRSFDSGLTQFGSTAPGKTYSDFDVLEVSGTGALMGSATDTIVGENCYYNSGWKYSSTGEASRLVLEAGNAHFATAPSGTADTAITWNTAIKAESDGTVKGLGGNWLISSDGIDITPIYSIVDYNGDAGSYVCQQFINDGTGTISSAGTIIGLSTTEDFVIRNQEATDIIFYTSDTFRGKIDAGGNWLVSPDGTEITPAYEQTIYVSTSTDNWLQFVNSATGTSTTDGFIIGFDSSRNATLTNYENTDMYFYTFNTLRCKIDQGGGFIADCDGTNFTPTYSLSTYDASSGSTYAHFTNSTTGNGSTAGFIIGLNSSEEAVLLHSEATDMKFYTDGAQRMYIDHSAGGLVVGAPAGAGQGSGTVNAASGLYENSVKIGNLSIGSDTTSTPATDWTPSITLDLDSDSKYEIEYELVNNGSASSYGLRLNASSSAIYATNGFYQNGGSLTAVNTSGATSMTLGQVPAATAGTRVISGTLTLREIGDGKIYIENKSATSYVGSNTIVYSYSTVGTFDVAGVNTTSFSFHSTTATQIYSGVANVRPIR